MTPSFEALQRRDAAAWDDFYRLHLHEIYGFVYRLVRGDRSIGDELFQEIWLAALEGIDQFDPGRGDLRAWLFGIARRQVALHWRRQTASCVIFTDDLPSDVINGGEGSILPDHAVEQLEEAAVVRASLLVLHPDRRLALNDKYVAGLSVEQIAARTGKSVKAVESLLSRARDELRSLLNFYFSNPTEGKRT
jgi:RNA polymerase sigma-70 factor, ECF subfamily